jgi:type II secretory pathway pseudopilin PulG
MGGFAHRLLSTRVLWGGFVMSQGNRPGFRLIELVTVLGMVLLLIGLLVPLVAQVRAAAAQVQCQNNLRQIGIAAHNLHDTYGHILGNPDTLNDRFGTLQYHLLPYME